MTRPPLGMLIAMTACGCGPAAPTPTAAPSSASHEEDAITRLMRELDAGPAPERRAQILMELAEIHLERGLAEGQEDTEPAYRDLRRAVELYETIVRDFPDHALVGHALYSIGYALNECDRPEDALIAWRAMVCANLFTYPGGLAERARGPEPAQMAPLRVETPAHADEADDPFAGCEARRPSPVLGEVWLRIGEVHFDEIEASSLASAASAYRQAIAHGPPPIAVLARYKLGWTHYRRDEYPQAIAAFVSLLDEGASGREPDLRREAIQYVAISLVEDDWDLDGAADAGNPPALERLRDPRLIAPDSAWLPAIFEMVGRVYTDLARYSDAAAVLIEHRHRFPDRCLAPESLRLVNMAGVDLPAARREELSAGACREQP